MTDCPSFFCQSLPVVKTLPSWLTFLWLVSAFTLFHVYYLVKFCFAKLSSCDTTMDDSHGLENKVFSLFNFSLFLRSQYSSISNLRIDTITVHKSMHNPSLSRPVFFGFLMLNSCLVVFLSVSSNILSRVENNEQIWYNIISKANSLCHYTLLVCSTNEAKGKFTKWLWLTFASSSSRICNAYHLGVKNNNQNVT